jgi:hypothetical protein
MKNSSDFKMVNALSALKMLLRSRSGLQSITITSRDVSEGLYAHTVTGIYSDGTETVISLDVWPTISTDDLLNGVFPLNERKQRSAKGFVKPAPQRRNNY